MIKQSRFKFGLIVIGVAFIAACLKMVWVTFPIVEFYGILGIIYGGYATTKAVTDTKEARYGCQNGAEK